MRGRARAWVAMTALSVVAGVVVAAVLPSPAGAAKVRAIKNVDRYYFHEGPDPIADSGGNIASVTVPAGRWAVFVRFWANNVDQSQGQINARCFLSLGSGSNTDGDNVAVIVPRTGGGLAASVVELTASHVSATAFPLVVNCTDDGTNTQYNHLRIQALKMDQVIKIGI